MKWYTGRGDSGRTSLPSMGEIWKDEQIVDAIGDLDELNSLLGIVGSIYPRLKNELADIQADIFSISSEIAGFNMSFNDSFVTKIEKLIDNYGSTLPPITKFIFPGGHEASAFLHFARAVCRRAERKVVSLYKNGKAKDLHVRYLNRLSSLLFVLAVWVNYIEGVENVEWKGKSK